VTTDGDRGEAGEVESRQVDAVDAVVPVAELIPATGRAHHQRVGTGIAEDLIAVAVPGVDSIIAVAAEDLVDPGAAVEAVVAIGAADDVAVVAAVDRLAAGAADHDVDSAIAVQPVA